MKFEVKCTRTIRHIIELILLTVLPVFVCIQVIISTTSESDLLKVAFWGIVITAFMMSISAIPTGGELVNSVKVNSDTVVIRKLFKSKKEMKVSDIKAFSVGQRKMRHGSRTCMHIYYDDTYVTLYADNVCNFDMLELYLARKHIPRTRFIQPLI